jgi:hypothetical protein
LNGVMYSMFSGTPSQQKSSCTRGIPDRYCVIAFFALLCDCIAKNTQQRNSVMTGKLKARKNAITQRTQ